MIEVTNSEQLKLIPIKDIIDSLNLNSTTRDPLQTVAQWCVDYLCNPHPDIGRPGAVCPWSPTAMKKETFWLAEILTQGRNEKDICQDVLSAINAFKQLSPCEGESTQYKTIVTVLHDLQPENRVDDLHALLKPFFLNEGLMLGEFYSTCDKPGLRNAAFCPLRSLFPLLVVREMLEFDIAFLADSEAYINAYLKRHGERGKTSIRAILNRREQLGFNQTQIAVLTGALDDKNAQ